VWCLLPIGARSGNLGVSEGAALQHNDLACFRTGRQPSEHLGRNHLESLARGLIASDRIPTYSGLMDRSGAPLHEDAEDFVSFLIEQYAKVYPWADVLALELNMRMTAAVSARAAASNRFFRLHGLERTSGRWAVLRVLFFTNESTEKQMALSNISVVLNVTPANITTLVDGLEKDGLVERVPHSSDKRSFLVRLTSRGEEICRDLIPALANLAEEECKGLTDDEKLHLIEVMKRIRQNAIDNFRENEDGP
jgi:MarR family transcriptional repressor of emrRAB